MVLRQALFLFLAVVLTTGLAGADPAPAPATAVAVPAAASSSPTVTYTYATEVIANAAARVVISTQRGSIDRFELIGTHPIRLPKHLHRDEDLPTLAGDPGQDLAVLAPFIVADTPAVKERATNQHAWLANDVAGKPAWGLTGSDFAPWTVAARSADAVTLRCDNGRGITSELTWRMHPTLPQVDARLTARNGTGTDLALNPALFPVNGIHQDYAPNEVPYITAFLHRGGEENGAIEKVAIPDAAKPMNPVVAAGAPADFVGLKSRFFAVWFTPGALSVDSPATSVPVEPVGATGPGAAAPTAAVAGSASPWSAEVGGILTAAHQDHQGYLKISWGPVAVPADRTLTATWSITASSMARSSLAAFGKAERRIDLTDWMHRTFILFTNALTWVLDKIVWLVGNYAIAVIIMTFLVKAVMFRLTWKQHASMFAMQKVAPELKYLQEQYKNDRQKLAQKQMELWKKHGVNPLGGCLPLVVQIPIFIALYNAFQYNADMRGAHFLWITDLTLPDQIWGTAVPFLHNWILSLNPLPIIYIGVTIWMSLTSPMPTNGDPQQEQMAKMMRWMPVLFGLIFYNMPAGLVLYFTVNAVLSTFEVKFIRRRLAAAGK